MSIIKRQRVNLEPYARASGQAHQEKSVRLLRRDGVVMALELSCSCGEVTVVEFGEEASGVPIAAEARLPEEEVQ